MKKLWKQKKFSYYIFISFCKFNTSGFCDNKTVLKRNKRAHMSRKIIIFALDIIFIKNIDKNYNYIIDYV